MQVRDGILGIPAVADPADELSFGHRRAAIDAGNIRICFAPASVVGTGRVVIDVEITVGISVTVLYRDLIAPRRLRPRDVVDDAVDDRDEWCHLRRDDVVPQVEACTSTARFMKIVAEGIRTVDGKCYRADNLRRRERCGK